MQVTVQGLASGRSYPIDYVVSDMDELLLFFLRQKGVTIASSCDGEGVCKRCNIQNDWLTCKLTLKKFLDLQPDGRIFVSYL